MTPEERGDLAASLFRTGYNCSQSVVLAFSDLTGTDPDALARLASSFGGGMGRLREVCGAVSGALMILGLLYGYGDPETGSVKAGHYARVQELALAFEKDHGSLVCRTLLGKSDVHDLPMPSERTTDFYETRPCEMLIRSSAVRLARYIEVHPPAERSKS